MPVTLSGIAPINACYLSYFHLDMRPRFCIYELLDPWSINESCMQGMDQIYNGWINQSSLSIGGVPENTNYERYMQEIMTLGGILPIGNHEVIWTSFPAKEPEST